MSPPNASVVSRFFCRSNFMMCPIRTSKRFMAEILPEVRRLREWAGGSSRNMQHNPTYCSVLHANGESPESTQPLALWINMALSRKGIGIEQFATDLLSGAGRRSVCSWAKGENAPQRARLSRLDR